MLMHLYIKLVTLMQTQDALMTLPLMVVSFSHHGINYAFYVCFYSVERWLSTQFAVNIVIFSKKLLL